MTNNKIQHKKLLNSLSKNIALLSFITSSVLMAEGYIIPETSLNAVALSSANVAHSHGADAAYYNPANMVFMKDENSIEVDMMYIGLDSITYKAAGIDIDTKRESFIVPSINYISGKAGETRIGISISTPAGLSKRWSAQPAKSSAEEFTLKVLELNPSVAIPIHDKVAIAFGFRIVYSEGIVKASVPGAYSKSMEGDSIDYGYNLALSYKPTSDFDVALTYRSQVNLSEDGSADLFFDSHNPALGGVLLNGNYDTAVTVPLPAIATVALAYTFSSKTTVEFLYERELWSAYNALDFNYANSTAEAVFGGVKNKNWSDSNNYRLGVTQELNALTLMAGAVYGETPIPDETISFESPDSNALSVSLGGRYKINEKLDIGLAALYSMRESRGVTNSALSGEFSNGNILLVSAGIGYKL